MPSPFNISVFPALATNAPALAAVIDGYTNISHRLGSRVGSEPLEDGASISDHAVAAPKELSLEGEVSGLNVLGISAKAGAAWALLSQFNKESKLINILTPWGFYENMIIRSLNAKQVGSGMRFSMELREVKRVGLGGLLTAERVTGPAEERTGEVKRGRVVAGETTRESAHDFNPHNFPVISQATDNPHDRNIPNSADESPTNPHTR